MDLVAGAAQPADATIVTAQVDATAAALPAGRRVAPWFSVWWLALGLWVLVVALAYASPVAVHLNGSGRVTEDRSRCRLEPHLHTEGAGRIGRRGVRDRDLAAVKGHHIRAHRARHAVGNPATAVSSVGQSGIIEHRGTTRFHQRPEREGMVRQHKRIITRGRRKLGDADCVVAGHRAILGGNRVGLRRAEVERGSGWGGRRGTAVR